MQLPRVWIFSATARGTRIDLTYAFELTSPLAAAPAWLALRLFKAWMQAALDRAAAVTAC